MDQTKVLLRPSEVVSLGYAGSKVSLWRLVKAGDFPKPIRMGPRAVGYRRADLDAWLASREPA